jgi:Arc/MetJ family transcription regulator
VPAGQNAGPVPVGTAALRRAASTTIELTLANEGHQEIRYTGGTTSRYCFPCRWGYMTVYMKTMIDLNDEALELAARELGTSTKKGTVNAALQFVASRRQRIDQLLDDPFALGVGPDIADAEIMRQARR